MRLVFDRQKELAEWMGRRLGTRLCEPYTIIGVEDRTGRLRAAFLFNDWNGTNVEMSMVSEGFLARGVMRALADYVWNQLGARRCTVKTSALKPHVIRMAQRAGWKIEGIHPLYYPDGSTAVSLGMLRADCQW